MEMQQVTSSAQALKRVVKLTHTIPHSRMREREKNLSKVLWMQVKGIKGKFKSNLWKCRRTKGIKTERRQRTRSQKEQRHCDYTVNRSV